MRKEENNFKDLPVTKGNPEDREIKPLPFMLSEFDIGCMLILSIVEEKQAKMKFKLRSLLVRYGKNNIKTAIETVGNNIFNIEAFLISQGYCAEA